MAIVSTGSKFANDDVDDEGGESTTSQELAPLLDSVGLDGRVDEGESKKPSESDPGGETREGEWIVGDKKSSSSEEAPSLSDSDISTSLGAEVISL